MRLQQLQPLERQDLVLPPRRHYHLLRLHKRGGKL
jgi:hypothetical protein